MLCSWNCLIKKEAHSCFQENVSLSEVEVVWEGKKTYFFFFFCLINSSLFLMVPEAWGQGASRVGFWWGPSPRLADSCLLAVSSHGREREREWLGEDRLSATSSCEGTNPVTRTPHSPKLNHLSKALLPSTTILGVRALTYKFEGDTIQSIALLQSWKVSQPCTG